MAFLSLLDDRAKTKGTRDPLGFEQVWTHFGRKIIGNLTTITSSLDNFAVALLGFKWANELNIQHSDRGKQTFVKEIFLKYEQLTGYLRYEAGDKDIMGITRITTRMRDEKFDFSLGIHPDEQILSDQASYGLWGLYSSAMKESGLIQGDARTPTPLGASIAQNIENRLDKTSLLNQLNEEYISREDIKSHAENFIKAIRDQDVQSLLLAELMNGSDSGGVQKELWSVTQELTLKTKQLPSLPSFISQVKKETNNANLRQYLADIEAVEKILVAANNLFNYCRSKDGEIFTTLLEGLAQKYNFSYLPTTTDLSLIGVPRSEQLTDIRNALRNHNFEDAIRNILDLNKSVMKQRDGAPWVYLEGNNTLRVRTPSEKAELMPIEKLKATWDYEYFLSSFIRIAYKELGAE